MDPYDRLNALTTREAEPPYSGRDLATTPLTQHLQGFSSTSNPLNHGAQGACLPASAVNFSFPPGTTYQIVNSMPYNNVASVADAPTFLRTSGASANFSSQQSGGEIRPMVYPHDLAISLEPNDIFSGLDAGAMNAFMREPTFNHHLMHTAVSPTPPVIPPPTVFGSNPKQVGPSLQTFSNVSPSQSMNLGTTALNLQTMSRSPLPGRGNGMSANEMLLPKSTNWRHLMPAHPTQTTSLIVETSGPQSLERNKASTMNTSAHHTGQGEVTLPDPVVTAAGFKWGKARDALREVLIRLNSADVKARGYWGLTLKDNKFTTSRQIKGSTLEVYRGYPENIFRSGSDEWSVSIQVSEAEVRAQFAKGYPASLHTRGSTLYLKKPNGITAHNDALQRELYEKICKSVDYDHEDKNAVPWFPLKASSFEATVKHSSHAVVCNDGRWSQGFDLSAEFTLEYNLKHVWNRDTKQNSAQQRSKNAVDWSQNLRSAAESDLAEKAATSECVCCEEDDRRAYESVDEDEMKVGESENDDETSEGKCTWIAVEMLDGKLRERVVSQ